MINQICKLEESIADKIKNYQKSLYDLKFDDEHVDKWISQFPEDERIIVLMETDNLLKHNYIHKKRIKNFFDDIWSTNEIIGTKSTMGVNKIQFLDIQQKGNSQKRLVDLLEKYYCRKKGITINRADHSYIQKYIYIDDCMFTGFTLLKDIDNWIDTMNPINDTQLDIVFLAIYNNNFDYVKGKVLEKCSKKNITVNFYWMHMYNNNFKNTLPYDALWPQRIDGDIYVNDFIQDMEKQKKDTGKDGLGFRRISLSSESKLFTSSQNRIIFEKALLKKGAYICSLPTNRNPGMKPMGYAHDISLGFGAFFATCYNISNNCPLAFWWGDIHNSPSETLGKWYPLLPRDVN